MLVHRAWSRAVFGVAIVLLLSACGSVNLPIPSIPGAAQSTGPGSQPAGKTTVVGKTRGNPQAPVTLVIYSDFQ